MLSGISFVLITVRIENAFVDPESSENDAAAQLVRLSEEGRVVRTGVALAFRRPEAGFGDVAFFWCRACMAISAHVHTTYSTAMYVRKPDLPGEAKSSKTSRSAIAISLRMRMI